MRFSGATKGNAWKLASGSKLWTVNGATGVPGPSAREVAGPACPRRSDTAIILHRHRVENIVWGTINVIAYVARR